MPRALQIIIEVVHSTPEEAKGSTVPLLLPDVAAETAAAAVRDRILSLDPSRVCTVILAAKDRDGSEYAQEILRCLDCGHVGMSRHVDLKWKERHDRQQ